MAKNDEMDSQLVPTILYQVQKNEEMDSQLEIICNPNGENNRNSDQPPSGQSIPQPASVDAPEKKLTLFAQRLAIIEKTASGLGQLAFIWANVILLGGFASNLKLKDFWFVTAILVVQGTLFFTRCCELEGQHQSTPTLPANTSHRQNQSHLFIPLQLVGAAMQALSISQPSSRLAYKMQEKRTCLPANVPLLPYSGWFFVSKNISLLLYWLQIFAPAACVALSLMRIGQQDYGDEAQINGKSALNVFYGLALAQGLVFLLEKGYWAWTIEHKKLVERVSKDCEDLIDMISLRRFFYDAYSQCINGSIFNGLKMDLLSFAEELLHSDSSDEQIIGARILQRLVENPQFAADTLRKIGSSMPVIERLIEMLNWNDLAKQDIRRLASKIVSKLASEKQQAIIVAAIPGAIESIASLLRTGGRTYEASPTAVIVDKEDFKLLGLLILKRLARYHDNCRKIGDAPGLLAEIIDLTSTSAALLQDEPSLESQIKTVRRALQVVKSLACATGQTGKTLRKDISENVNSVRNINDLLQYGGRHSKLQILGLQILTSLAMSEEGRKKIEATEGMLKLILRAFFQPIVPEEEVGRVCNEAGEALAMLILDSRKNCQRMLSERNDVVTRLVDALENPVLKMNAARILRTLCAYSAPKGPDRPQIVATMPMVLKTILEENENEKLLEALIGLAIQILEKYINNQQFENEIERAGIRDEEFVRKLVEILRRYGNPESKVPRMRRFVIELAIAMMKNEDKYIELFRGLGMEQVLKQTAETTSELECFNVYSGSVGLGILEEKISNLVQIALRLLGSNIQIYAVYELSPL